MMSMMSRTSITSISGVVLMSTITSGSLVPPAGSYFHGHERVTPLASRSAAAAP